MPQPTTYNRVASFSNIQSAAPAAPLPGNTVDLEYNAIKVTLDELLANLALIQRDDGALANESVGRDQLADDIELGFEAPEVWLTATAYALTNTVFHGAGFYRCLVAHTSGVFATDLTAAKWELIVDLSAIPLVAAAQIAFTPVGTIAATDVQAAIAELGSEKAALSHTHLASAISDSTTAGRAMLTAVDAAAQQVLLGLGDLAFLDTIPVTEIDAELALTGIISPNALAADIDDWEPTGWLTNTTVRFSCSSAINITGLKAASDGDIKILHNTGSFTATLKAENTSSAAVNRISTETLGYPVVAKGSVALQYDATSLRWRPIVAYSQPQRAPRGYLSGFACANNATDATNDIDIGTGLARDSSDTQDLRFSTALTKRLDAAWAAGTNAGMRSSAAIANGTWHIFCIGKADGTTDILAHTAVDPTAVLPSGYLYYRHIYSVLRESASLIAFVHDGDYTVRAAVKEDISATDPGTTAVTRILSVPTGINVRAELFVSINNSDATLASCLLSPLSATNEAPVLAIATTVSKDGIRSAGAVFVRTDTSASIRSRVNYSSANVVVNITTRGWHWSRGRDS